MVYDIVFLGGGPAGYEGGIAAGKNGLKTAVVEMNKLGGTCLHWGCIPTKTLIHSVKILKQVKNSAKLGIKIDDYKIDIPEMLKNKERVVTKLYKGIEYQFEKNKVDFIKGEGKIISPDTVLVNGESELKTKHIVISTGSRAMELPFLKFDGFFVMDSDTALELADIPEKLLVIGAGAVGIELGIIYSFLGSEVTIIEMFDHILPGTDIELTEILQNELSKQKIKILVSTTIINASRKENSINCGFKQGEKVWEDRFTKVLVAAGRSPVVEDAVDVSLNIKKDPKGFLEVNENLQTNLKNVFACGDVIGPPLLAHKASHQAISIVDFIHTKKQVAHPAIPAAVFSIPEIATVGLTEMEAKKREMTIKVGRFPYSAGSRSNAVDEKRGLVKIVSDEQGYIIGGHIVGAEAGELMPIITYAVNSKMKAMEFKELIFIHPTLGENVWEALGSIGGFSIHI